MIFFYLLIAIMPFVRHSLWNETMIAGVTLNKFLGIVCLFVAFAHYAARPTAPRFFQTVQSRLFVVFGLATMISFVAAGPTVYGEAVEASPIGTWVSLLLLLFVTLSLLSWLDRLRYALLSLVGGLAFASLHSIREWAGVGMMGDYRPGWVTGDPNYFALSALLSLPLSLLLAQELEQRLERAFCLACFAVTLFAFILAGSRGAFFGLLVSFMVVAWHSRHRSRYLAVGAILIAALLVVAPSSPFSRLLHPTQGDQESTEVRTALMWAGLNMFEHHIWTGIGVGNFKVLVGLYGNPDESLMNVAHNTYLEVAAELGIFGFLTFIAILGFSLLSLRRVRLVTRGRASETKLINTAARALEAGLLGGCVTILFLSAANIRIMWFVVILSMCLPPLAPRAGRRPAAPPTVTRAPASVTR